MAKSNILGDDIFVSDVQPWDRKKSMYNMFLKYFLVLTKREKDIINYFFKF